MSAPRRIQRQRTKGWRMPHGALYVGRGSRWGNPFSVSGSGHSLIGPEWFVARSNWGRVTAMGMTAAYVTSSRPISSEDVVRQFVDLLKVRRRDESDRLDSWMSPLIGRDLACWCPLGQPCHADVLLELANGGAA